MTIQEIRTMFEQINRDCAESGESVVAFDDVEYYTEQILICEIALDPIEARRMAEELRG